MNASALRSALATFVTLFICIDSLTNEFQIFRSNLELNLDSLSCCHLFLTVLIGDFNAKSKQWCEIDTTRFEGSQLQLLISKFGLSQLITEPTYILENSRSCIDLLFKFQPNMIMDSGVHASVDSQCHHQIIFAKFDLKSFLSTSFWENCMTFFPSEIWSYKISSWIVWLEVCTHWLTNQNCFV